MKILQINKYFYRKGGAETVFFNTIKLLEKHGHTVIPFCLKNRKNDYSDYERYFVDYPELSESSFIEKFKHLTSFIYNQKAAKNLESLIKKERPDIAHIHLLFNGLSVSILPILKKYKIPVVMSVHDYRLVYPAYTFTDGKGNFCERCKDKHFYHCITHRCSNKSLINSFMLSMDSYFRKHFYSPINYIDRFIFVSQFSMNKHLQVESQFKGKCNYLYNFTPSLPDLKTHRGDYMFFFGRISKEKGLFTLLKAIEKCPDIKLKLAGTGPLLDRLKSQCPPNAEFLGFKQGEELRELIHNAAFVVVPSECYENNPMTIIESYMIGTPVIGSDLGGIPELIPQNVTGYTFTPKSVNSLITALRQALSLSDSAYEEMTINAKRFARENFSEESHYNKLYMNYQLAIQKK